jgi:hypothetical protein
VSMLKAPIFKRFNKKHTPTRAKKRRDSMLSRMKAFVLLRHYIQSKVMSNETRAS